MVDAETSVQKKPGLRGAAQKNAIDAKMDYLEKALELSLHNSGVSHLSTTTKDED